MHAAGHVQRSARFERLVEEPRGQLVVQDRVQRTVAVVYGRAVTSGICEQKNERNRDRSIISYEPIAVNPKLKKETAVTQNGKLF